MVDNGKAKELCLRAVMRSADALDTEQVELLLRRSLDRIADEIDVDLVQVTVMQIAVSAHSPGPGVYESETDWGSE